MGTPIRKGEDAAHVDVLRPQHDPVGFCLSLQLAFFLCLRRKARDEAAAKEEAAGFRRVFQMTPLNILRSAGIPN